MEKLEEYKILFQKWFQTDNLVTLKEKQNFERIFAIYHSIQLMVEVITDVIAMMVKDLGLSVEDNYENMQKLFRREYLSPKMYEGLKKLNGLRNRIAHDYNGLIDNLVWASIEENKKIIDDFEEVVENWLNQKL